MELHDDDLSSQLKAVLTERKQSGDAALNEEMESALLEGVEPVAPPSEAFAGLLAQIRATDRMTHFAPNLAQLYDLSTEEALALIARIRGTEGWMPGPAPGVKILPVQAGPRVGEALTAVVLLEADAQFPHHPHIGAEKVLVLEGAYLDSSGREFWRGDLHQSETGSEHAFTAIGGIPCICAGLNAVSAGDAQA